MNLIEAIQSRLPFDAEDGSETGLVLWQCADMGIAYLTKAGTGENRRHIKCSDLDKVWKTQEPKVTITQSQIRNAIEEIARETKLENDYGQMAHGAQILARKLGLGD